MFYERQQRFDDAEYELLALMRQALSVPEGDLALDLLGFEVRDTTQDATLLRAG